jgi:hypothetical protein
MEDKKFKATPSLLVQVITHGSIIVAMLVFFYSEFSSASIYSYLFPIVLLLLVFSAWLFHPQYYLLTRDTILIKLPVKTIEIPIAGISYVESISREEMGFAVRLFACGGLFGYFGLYRSMNLGKFDMWCANKDHMVVIKDKKDKVVVISPSDHQRFVELIHEYAARWKP